MPCLLATPWYDVQNKFQLHFCANILSSPFYKEKVDGKRIQLHCWTIHIHKQAPCECAASSGWREGFCSSRKSQSAKMRWWLRDHVVRIRLRTQYFLHFHCLWVSYLFTLTFPLSLLYSSPSLLGIYINKRTLLLSSTHPLNIKR